MKDPDQRKEPRVRWRGPVSVRVGDANAFSGKIYDISASGIAVVAEGEISVGTSVQIDGDGFSGQGIVRYCCRHGEGYRLGVALEPVEPT
jgi:hypothetical protein